MSKGERQNTQAHLCSGMKGTPFVNKFPILIVSEMIKILNINFYTRIKCVIILTISSMDGRCEGSLDQQRVIKLSIGLGKFLISGGRVPVIEKHP